MTGRSHPIRRDYPFLDSLPPAGRRRVMQAMGAGLALLAAGCDEAPPERAVNYVRDPEGLVPGVPRLYATSVEMDGIAQPVLAEVHMGRPTRLEGNGLHPGNHPAASVFAQAEVLSLYDPHRAATALMLGRPVETARILAALDGLVARLDGKGGQGFRLLTGPVSSPTRLRLMAAMERRWPGMRRHVHSPAAGGGTAAARLAFGQPASVVPELERAGPVVCLGADPLGPGPAQVPNGLGWAARRAAMRDGERPPAPLMVAEVAPSLTGARAEVRLAVRAGRLPLLVQGLAAAFTLPGHTAPANLTAAEQAWLDQAAGVLRAAGPDGLLLAGPPLGVEAQALALAIADRLGQPGRTLTILPPLVPEPGADAGLPALVRAMAAGDVDTLLVLDANPVYTAPMDVPFAAALAGVPLSVHAGTDLDETALACGWHIPLVHALESWGDARDPRGIATLRQPTVRPLRPALQPLELLGRLAGDGQPAADILRDTWVETVREMRGGWPAALRHGFIPGSAPAPLAVAARVPPSALPPPPTLLDIVFRCDPCVWDGRYTGNAWLEELPKPLTKVTWGNVAWVGPDVAARLGLGNGTLVEVVTGGGRVTAPVFVKAGQAPETVVLHLGYGRRAGAGPATGLGHDAYTVRPADSPWLAAGDLLRPGGRQDLATTQRAGVDQHPADLVRTVPLVALADQASLTAPVAGGPTDQPPSLHPDWAYPVNAWAMAIDLDACIGCNACVIACQAENNVPVVGREEVLRGRAMHWLRIEAYAGGRQAEAGNALFLPVLCMHCEKAPCEVGCPVKATVHGPDGLNQMIYNRCIGTRTCAAYCPYEVRRFNYSGYAADMGEGAGPQFNPDVTVRAEGVMEKCTWCTQRISAARIAARLEGRPIRDGEVVTACQSACPTRVFTFGDLNDADSAVSRAVRSGRAYHLLEELGTRPRTSYLARVDMGERTA